MIKTCDFEDEDFKFIIEPIEDSFFLVKTAVPASSSIECFKSSASAKFSTCDSDDPEFRIYFTYSNTVEIELVNMSDYGF